MYVKSWSLLESVFLDDSPLAALRQDVLMNRLSANSDYSGLDSQLALGDPISAS